MPNLWRIRVDPGVAIFFLWSWSVGHNYDRLPLPPRCYITPQHFIPYTLLADIVILLDIDRDTVHILSPHCHFLMLIAFIAANPFNFASRVLVSWLAFLFVWIILTPHQIKWDQQYAEFEEHVKMPERNTTLDNWKNNQLSIGCDSLDAKIANEIEEKERGTIWSGLRQAKVQEKHLTK